MIYIGCYMVGSHVELNGILRGLLLLEKLVCEVSQSFSKELAAAVSS